MLQLPRRVRSTASTVCAFGRRVSRRPKRGPRQTESEPLAPSDLVTAFVKHLRDLDRSAATVAGYQNDVQQFAKWLAETRGESYRSIQEFVRAITPTDIREYRTYLLNVQRASPATINHRIISLRVLTRWARREGWIEGDPVNGIRPVKQVALAPRWLDRKEQYALRRTAEKDGNRRNLAIILLLMNTGLRVSEVAGLRLDDLQLSERKGEVTVRGKGLKVRTVSLNADVRKALREYLAKRPKAEHDAVFVGQKGDPLGKLGIEYQIATLGRLSGFVGSNGAAERLTPHMLRHTFAKNLVDQGVGLDQVAMLMGHRSLTTTARYTKPSKQDLAKAVEKLEEK